MQFWKSKKSLCVKNIRNRIIIEGKLLRSTINNKNGFRRKVMFYLNIKKIGKTQLKRAFCEF